jgi:hypothetical protein
MHPVQIALLGAAPAFWRDFRSKARPWIDKAGVALFIFIGVAGTGYDLVRSRLDYLRQPVMGDKAAIAADAAAWIKDGRTRLAVDPRTFGPTGNPFFIHLLRYEFVLADDQFNAFPYGPDRKHVESVATDMIEVFSAKTARERRLDVLKRYNVSRVLIDAYSELFDRDMKETFGPDAGSVFSGARWRLIDLNNRPEPSP